MRQMNVLSYKSKPKPTPVDELAPIRSPPPSRVLPAFDEHAPISDKPATSVSNRFSALSDRSSRDDEKDGCPTVELPLEQFVKPSKKKLKKIKYLINAKMNQNPDCKPG